MRAERSGSVINGVFRPCPNTAPPVRLASGAWITLVVPMINGRSGFPGPRGGDGRTWMGGRTSMDSVSGVATAELSDLLKGVNLSAPSSVKFDKVKAWVA